MKHFFSLTQQKVLDRQFNSIEQKLDAINNHIETNLEIIDSNVEKHKADMNDQLSALERRMQFMQVYVIIVSVATTIAIGCSIYAINQ